jgi:hypothetical protein
MEAASTSETSVYFYRTTRRIIPEDIYIHTCCRQNVKSRIIDILCLDYWSWGSTVSVVSDYRLDDRGSIPGQRHMIFPLASMSRPALRLTQPPIQWVPEVLSPGLDADQSPPTAEVKNVCPSWRLHGVEGQLCVPYVIRVTR